MKWKAVVPIAIILAVLALTLTACGPDIEEKPTTMTVLRTSRRVLSRPRVDCNTK